MKDPRVIFREIATTMSLSHLDVVCSEIDYINILCDEIKVLDLGAGSGWYWQDIAMQFPSIRISVTLLDAAEIEEHPRTSPNLQMKRIVGQIPNDLKNLADNSFDLVIAFDLIEHLTKDAGYLFLYEVDRIAARSSVIFTPNGFVWQPPSSNNPYNAHISGWTPREMSVLGWKNLQGHNGMKILRGPYAEPKAWIKFWFLLELDALLTIITSKFYNFSFAFSSTKRHKNPRVNEQNFS